MRRLGILQGRVRPDIPDGPLQTFPARWDEELVLIADLGFGCVELLDDKGGAFRALVDGRRDELLERVRTNKLEVKSICIDLLCDHSLLDDERDFLDRLTDLVERFRDIPDLCYVVPFFDCNNLGSAFELQTCVQRLSGLDSLLASVGSCLALETELSAVDIREALRDAPSGTMKVCYDLGNAIGMGYDLANEIRFLGGHIAHVHVKDKLDGKSVPLRRDNAQLAGGFRALGQIGYDGAVVLETWTQPDPVVLAHQNLDTARRLLDGGGVQP